MPRFWHWLAMRIVAAAARLVPAAARADWLREWHAELRHRAAQLQRRPRATWRTHMDLVDRALGALPDAAWLRRQFTLDADAVHDAAHGLRTLMRAPGFTLVALLVFAIGIGATTAIVSVADALLLQPLPVPHAERVMTVWQANRATGSVQDDLAPGNALDWMERARSFQAVAMVEPWSINAAIPGRDPEYLTAARVSESFFEVLGAPLSHGRPFLPAEYRRGSGRFAILSHALWRDRFGSDAGLIGRAVQLDAAEPFTLVGVMPRRLELRLFDNRFKEPEPMVWLPKQGFEEFEENSRAMGYWNLLGRLAPGVSVAQAQAELDVLADRSRHEYPQANRDLAAQVVPLREHLVGSLRVVLPLLLGAAAILLLVACTNVANLLLARGTARTRELAVRRALGASRRRLIRQLLVETLVLAVAGGALGLLLARGTLDAIARLRPLDVARLDSIPLDARAAAIACGLTLLAALAAGLAPALQLSRPAAAEALKEARTSPRRGARGVLVIAEVAAALVLAVGAGLLVRSFLLIQGVDPGFDRERVAVLQLFASPRIDTPQKRIAFFGQALERMRALPGVVSAGGVTAMPFGQAAVIIRAPLAVAGRAPAAGEESQAYATAVADDYFRALGVPLLKGRLFDATDTGASRQVLLVSRGAAQRFWPGADPIGSRVRFRAGGISYDAEVVGVVGEVRHESLDRPAAPEVYVPYSQSGFRALSLVVRTAPGSPTTLSDLKRQVWALDPLQAIYHGAWLDHLVGRTLTGRRFSLFLLGGFAAATLLLAAAGVYGVMSFSTTQRTREFGVRRALGAERRDIVALVVGDGLRLAGAGVLVGTLLALPLAPLLRTLLFGVPPLDPVTFAGVAALLMLVAAAACYLPARRALAVEPTEALRVD